MLYSLNFRLPHLRVFRKLIYNNNNLYSNFNGISSSYNFGYLTQFKQPQGRVSDGS